MSKIGILTFHYSTNYGAVLQATALLKVLHANGYDAEIINFVPSNYRSPSLSSRLKKLFHLVKTKGKILKKLVISTKYKKSITDTFNQYRGNNLVMSSQVNEKNITDLLANYHTIIVGSDQVWNPSQRKKSVYFLNFGSKFLGQKIAYAADSSSAAVSDGDKQLLRSVLDMFSGISVRNEHSLDFVKTVTGQEPEIVADPTLLYDFEAYSSAAPYEPYILEYTLGSEIAGTNRAAVEVIKKIHGNLKVHSIKDPTSINNLCDYADIVHYDLGPNEWINMIQNASFVFTDSYHGVLFSIKYHKPFLAYYAEDLRAGRLIDTGKRYGIERHIIRSIDEIRTKKSLEIEADFESIDKRIKDHKELSISWLFEALRTKKADVGRHVEANNEN